MDRDLLDRDPLLWKDTPLYSDPLDRDTLQQRCPWTDTSGQRNPQTETLLDIDPWTETTWTETPGQRPPEGTWDQRQRPPGGTWEQAARQEVTSYRDPPVNRMTHTSENITLPQTSFAGGNKCVVETLAIWVTQQCTSITSLHKPVLFPFRSASVIISKGHTICM